ncbi:hypothetical protein F3B23_19115 [Bacteroides fragilis]|uniref:Uncharacterized protein n=1 Tax=Bacteroides fragilis TaxID=817 RepID=A0A396EJV1_BACFG|nr:hypothetical protein F3B28_19435 [Bacteroides fragilis]KAA4706161.1 hypothetical protein F3B27_19480 [Bacteroides fragilis]KAA4713709.1 hypothetical protein F3B32_20015 [Bacteroides fragilis]KAA4726949.1 hypothetical protein F3B30_13440 [Bacteroides fragilis]KAA4727892.1 hypothetical protein F3B23_19115 [Bacteroides fragilis]
MFKRLVLCKQNACFNTLLNQAFYILKVKSFKLLIQSGSLLFLVFLLSCLSGCDDRWYLSKPQ